MRPAMSSADERSCRRCRSHCLGHERRHAIRTVVAVVRAVGTYRPVRDTARAQGRVRDPADGRRGHVRRAPTLPATASIRVRHRAESQGSRSPRRPRSRRNTAGGSRRWPLRSRPTCRRAARRRACTRPSSRGRQDGSTVPSGPATSKRSHAPACTTTDVGSERGDVTRPLLLPGTRRTALVLRTIAVDHERIDGDDRTTQDRAVPDHDSGLGRQPARSGLGIEPLRERRRLGVADHQHLQRSG